MLPYDCSLVRSLAATLAAGAVLSACGTAERAPPGQATPSAAPVSRESQKTQPDGRPQEVRPATPFAREEAMRTVYFRFSETMIDGESEEILRQNAQKLKEDPQLVVTLVGHTDNLGSAAYNLAVADKRIEAVSERLRSLGVARNQIRRLPLGSEQSSKMRCDNEACRQKMRRVELVYERR